MRVRRECMKKSDAAKIKTCKNYEKNGKATHRKCIPIVYRGAINCNINPPEDRLTRTRLEIESAASNRSWASSRLNTLCQSSRRYPYFSAKRGKRHVAASVARPALRQAVVNTLRRVNGSFLADGSSLPPLAGAGRLDYRYLSAARRAVTMMVGLPFQEPGVCRLKIQRGPHKWRAQSANSGAFYSPSSQLSGENYAPPHSG